MNFNAFINFDGNCAEAVAFYAKVFKQSLPKMMRFGDAPVSEGYQVSEADKNRVLYTELKIGDKTVMFSDCGADGGFVCGNNVCLVLGSKDEAEIKRLYNAFKESGKILMPLQKTFWSDSYGMVEDKFGVIWQISLEK